MDSNFNYLELSIGELYDNSQKGKIIIPKYQRTIKWNDENRLSLIESIQKGNPIGAILVQNNKFDGTYTIIDGLQRTSTIVDFFNNSYKYISRENISNKLITDITDIISVSYTEDHLRDTIYNIITSYDVNNNDDDINSTIIESLTENPDENINY